MRTELRKRITQYAAVMLLTAVSLSVYYILHQFQMRELWVYDADKAVDDFVRGIVQTGGTQAAFFGFNLQNLVIFVLGRICGDAIFGMNLYYIMTFFMISGASYWCMKTMGISGRTALFISVLLSFVPFHIDRGQGQIITSSFFLVPVFLGLLYQIFSRRTVQNFRSVLWYGWRLPRL